MTNLRRGGVSILGATVLFLVSAVGPIRATTVSPGTEVAAALALREDFVLENAFVHDPAVVDRVQELGRRLARHSDRPDLPWAFFVLSEASAERPEGCQARSLPGGTVALDRGLVHLLEDEDQLAFVLAHEIAHVARRHHVSVAALIDGDEPEIVEFRRRLRKEQEIEADRIGALYLVGAGYRFSAADEALARIDSALGDAPRDLRDHPTFVERRRKLHAFRPVLERSIGAFERGREFLLSGRYDESLTALTIFIQQFPYSVAGRVNLGTACLVKLNVESGSPGGLEEPLPLVESSGIELRGVYDGELLERARHNFGRALAVQPRHRDALVGLALVGLRRGDIETATALLDRVKEVETQPEVLLALGNTSFLAGEPGKAAEWYRRALVTRRGWPSARKNLAVTYDAMGFPERAAEIWRELLTEPRFDREARLQLAIHGIRDGD